MSGPRLASGNKLHLLGEAYAVLLDADGAEVSAREPGSLWLGFVTPDYEWARTTIVYSPHSTNIRGLVELAAIGTADRAAVYFEDEMVCAMGIGRRVYKGTTVSIDFRDMLTALA